MSILVLLEHRDGQFGSASLRAVTFARQLAELDGDPYDLLALGSELDAAAAGIRNLGARRVLLADHPGLAHPLAGRFAAVLAFAGRPYRVLLAAASTGTRDILPRTAALLEAGMLSDVTGVTRVGGERRYTRPVYAGNAIGTCTVDGEPVVLSCRATAFSPPEAVPAASPVESLTVDAALLQDGMEFVSAARPPGDRPELTEARVVVSGGRPLRDTETFNRLIGGLADTLGAAVGATRAAVDAGIAPNDWQVGQTGKVVAPELYIGCGVSGAIQHLAGMKDSRVIVAINKDPEAPFCQVATYSLVADLFQAVPELTEALAARRDG